MCFIGQKNIQVRTFNTIHDETRSLNVVKGVAIHCRPDVMSCRSEKIQRKPQKRLSTPDVFKHEHTSTGFENLIEFFESLNGIGYATKGASSGHCVNPGISSLEGRAGQPVELQGPLETGIPFHDSAFNL